MQDPHAGQRQDPEPTRYLVGNAHPTIWNFRNVGIEIYLEFGFCFLGFSRLLEIKNEGFC
jgi:hypothetical protein